MASHQDDTSNYDDGTDDDYDDEEWQGLQDSSDHPRESPRPDHPHSTDDRKLILRTSREGYYSFLLRTRFEKVKLSRLHKNEVLKQDNWIQWKSIILQNLRANRLDGFPLGTFMKPDDDVDFAEQEAWDIMDQAALLYIKSNIHPDQLVTIPQFLEINNSTSLTQTSFQAWDILCQMYEAQTSQSAYNLFYTLCQMVSSHRTTNVTSHLIELQNLRTKLANLEYPMDDNLFNGMLCGSLPRSWYSYVTGLHGVQAGGTRKQVVIPTLRLISMIQDEDQRRKAEDNHDDVSYRSGSAPNPRKRLRISRDEPACRICKYTNHTTEDCRWKTSGGFCSHCQRGGHWTSQCQGGTELVSQSGKGKSRARNPRGGRANVARNDASASTSTNSQNTVNQHVSNMATNDSSDFTCYEWLADCATTSHIVIDQRYFSNYVEIDETITSVGRTKVKAIGCGTIILKSHVDGNTRRIVLHDVFHVPTTSDNLLSVGRYVKSGGKFKVEDETVSFYSAHPHRLLMITGKRIDTLFYLDVEPQVNEAYVTKRGTLTWLDWHKRFGHIGVSGLQHLRCHNLVDGFNVDEDSTPRDCESCIQAKQHQTPFPQSVEQTTMYAGELTHADLWGPA
jgi:hypothetical protein